MKYLKFIIFFLLIIIIFSCNTNQKKPPMAKQGILDLRNWDFEKDGIVRLDGDWEFYWKQFLKSADFDTVRQKHYIQVPKPWNDYKWGKEELGYEGYATYRLRIIVNDKTKDFGLKFPDQGTAFELYLNDSLVGKNGKIGKSRETSEPQYKTLLIPFEKTGDTITLICQVSNYDFHWGGIEFSSQLSRINDIMKIKEMNEISDFIFISLILIFCFILLTFYILRPKELASLYLAIFCLAAAIRISTTYNKQFLIIFPDISWELLIKLEASWLLLIPLFALYLSSIFKGDYPKLFLMGYLLFYVTIGVITYITPARINSFVITISQFVLFIFALHTVFFVVRAVYRKRDGAPILLFGFIVIAFGSVNEMLYFRYIAPLILNFPTALIIFCFSNIILISYKFARSFKRIEVLSIELHKSNIELEMKVNERTQELKFEKDKTENLLMQSDRLLLNVLPEQIATRLKAGETSIADHFEEASVIFIDIVDFTKSSAVTNPKLIVEILNVLYTKLDAIAQKHGLEKIKTIGDCYMAAAGIPTADPEHAQKAAKFALEAMSALKDYDTGKGVILNFRCGIDCGPVVAGVIGENKFIYDVWGDMVNTASRMETNGIIGKIQVTERFKEKLSVVSSPLSDKGDSNKLPATDNRQLATKFEERGEIEIKGKGKMKTWFLIEN